MELQFQNTPLRCLRCSASGNAETEQTLELRIGEDLPPVGRVLGAWGQPLIRGKEWRGDQVRVHGGVMARALYEAEGADGIYAVEGWMPFQLHWDLTDSHSDGKTVVSCCLSAMDARQIGAEKLMLRATVNADLQAMEREEYPVYTPRDLPEDILVKMGSSMAHLPVEVGETALSLEDEVTLPSGKTEVARILFYNLMPAVSDKKLMGDKMVFRGTAELCMVYLGADGRVHEYRTQLPISQYGEMEQEYGPDAQLWVEPMVTDLELALLEDGRIRLKAGVVGQYVVCDSFAMKTVQDAYSTKREVTPQFQQMTIPSVQKMCPQTVSLRQGMDCRAEQAVCAAVCARKGKAAVEGTIQALYYDPEGHLQFVSSPFAEEMTEYAPSKVSLMAAGAEVVTNGGAVSVQTQIPLWVREVQAEEIAQVSALSVGESVVSDPNRPSLILRRMGASGLWELAKHYGSTEEKIRNANGLLEEPEMGRLLLIPVE